MSFTTLLRVGYVSFYLLRCLPVMCQTATVTSIQPNISWGGRAVAVTVSPSNLNFVVAAAFSGGLFRSLDGGQTWSHMDSFPANRMWDVKFNPSNGSELVASVLNDTHVQSLVGVWISRDAGNSWTQAPLAGCGNPPFGRQISFGPSPNIFVGTDCGLAASHDDGMTWNYALVPGVPTVVAQPGPNFPGDPNSVQVDGCDSGGTPQHSPDNGNTFTPLSRPGAGCVSIAQDPHEPNVLLAATTAGELWESDNTGASWTLITSLGSGARYHWIRTGPNYPGLGFQTYFHNGADMWLINCAGPVPGNRCTTPTPFTTFPFGAHHDFGGIAVPTSSCKIYTAGDGGIEVSVGCAGPPFTETNQGFNALQIYRIAGTVHPDHTDLYIAMQDDGLWASPDGGVTWENGQDFDSYIVEAPHSSTGPGQPVNYLMVSPGSYPFLASADLVNPTSFQLPPNSSQYSDFYLLGGGNQGPTSYLHTDDGCDPPSSAPCFLWVGDVNANWTKQSPALPFKMSGMSRRLYISGPAANPTVYVTTNKIDANGNWFDGLSRITGINQPSLTIQPADIGLGSLGNWGPDDGPFVIPRVVGVDPNNPQHLIAADVSINKMVVSTSGGNSWTPDDQLTALVTNNGNLLFSSPNVGCQAHAIAFDPSNGRRIFVGTEASGLIATLDNGQTWFRVPGTQQINAISDFFFDEIRGALYVASYGRGLWKVTGVTPPPVIQITNLTHSGSNWCATVNVTENGQPVSGTVTIHGVRGPSGQRICFPPCLNHSEFCNPQRKPPCITISTPVSCQGTVTVGSQTISILVGPPLH